MLIFSASKGAGSQRGSQWRPSTVSGEEMSLKLQNAALMPSMAISHIQTPSDGLSAIEHLVDILEKDIGDLRARIADLRLETARGQVVRVAPRLLTVQGAATKLGVGVTTVHSLIRSGSLASIKIGSARRIPIEAIDDFIASEASPVQRG